MSLRAGVDLGGTKIQAVIVDREGDVKGSSRRPTPTTGGPPGVAAAIGEAVREAAAAAATEPAELSGAGVGAPGGVDNAAGTVTNAGNLPDWRGTFDLAGALAEDLGVPVALGNDVDVATLAEFELGAAREYRSLLGVFWGTGVGGGIILNGELWHGRASAGELGHIVVEMNGDRCPCGRLGCLEAYAGRGAMEARARKALDEGQQTVLFDIMERKGKDRLTSGVFSKALDQNDAVATALINRAIEALGNGVASAVNLLDVEAVIIGGGLGVRLGEPFAERIARAMQPHLFSDHRPPVVRVAALGDLGGAVGAALLAA
jgi:glucokinase